MREKIEEKNVDQLHAYKAIKQVISPLHTINPLTFQGNTVTSLRRTPLGPALSVRLREMSVL